jgi:hypothetical protein
VAASGQREPRKRRGRANARASTKAGLTARDPRDPIFANGRAQRSASTISLAASTSRKAGVFARPARPLQCR